jgi:ABC-type cobalamin/Fe3+-siderophores transport system ATPase subunit
MADIESKPVNWLWEHRIPSGRITVLVGMPGAGKSFVTCDIAAHISKGGMWPDGSECQQGSVILISAEDDPHDTIRPRLDALQAEVRHIHIMSTTSRSKVTGQEMELPFSLSDLDLLEAALKELDDCRLIVVDPIGSFLGRRLDAHRENEVRAVLGPLASLAKKHDVAILLVAHRRKSSARLADDLVLGSRAFTAVARCVWHLMEDPKDPEFRLVLPGKNNIARKGKGLAFTINGEPGTVEWQLKPIEVTANQILAQENDSQTSAVDEAIEWLESFLAKGPMLGGKVKVEARTAGISSRTLDRAKKKLGVKSVPEGQQGRWVWRLPESDSVKTVANTEDTGEHWDETDTFPESDSDETVAHTEDTGEVSEDTEDFYPGPEEEELPF